MPVDRTRAYSEHPIQRLSTAHASSASVPPSPTPSSATTFAVVREDDTVSCQRCRHRKKKCDRLRPACAGCLKSGSECVYEVSSLDKHSSQYVASLLAETKRLREHCKELEDRLALSMRQPQVVSPSAVAPLPSPFPTYPASMSSQSPTNGIIQRALIRLLTKEQDPGSSVRANIGRQLGTTPADDHVNPTVNGNDAPLWPPRSVVPDLLDYFFDLSFGTMRFVDRAVIEQDLESTYTLGGPDPPDPTLIPVPDIRVLRLSLFFSSVSDYLHGSDETVRLRDSARLYRFALQHLPAAFQYDGLTCLTCIGMLSMISIHELVTMSPYETVGIAAAVALELGLNEDDHSLPLHAQDERRRLFWTLFCADRAVSTYLVKPVAIPENVISIRLPQAHIGGAVVDSPDIQPTVFFRQYVLMRRLHGVMLDKIHLAPEIIDPEAVLIDLRNRIDDWWTDTLSSASNGFQHPILELNYNLFLTNLYRPSRLFAQTPPLRMPLLRSASYRAISLYRTLHSRRRIAQSYIHLYNIVVLAVSMLYTVGEAEGDIRNFDIGSWRAKALGDIEATQTLLSTFCTGWPGVNRFRQAFAALAANVKVKLIRPGVTNDPPDWALPLPDNGFTNVPDVQQGGEIAQMDMGMPTGDFMFDSGSIDVEAFLSSMGLSEWTSGV